MSYSNKTHVITLHDEVSTSRLSRVIEDPAYPDHKLVFYNSNDPKYAEGRCYQFLHSSITILTSPVVFSPDLYSFIYRGEELKDIYVACRFQGHGREYWTIGFLGPQEDLVCKGGDIVVKKKRGRGKNKNALDYLTAMSYFHGYEVRSDTNKEPLGSQYAKMKAQKESPLLDAYLNPTGFSLRIDNAPKPKIYPFGLNTSQLSAIRNAMSNRISVVMGPPGTGKTQTILNILANLLVEGKTALVVAGSNDAAENIYDKLKNYGLEFFVAPLGSKKKKDKFFSHQKIAGICNSEKGKEVDMTVIESLVEELEPLFEKNKEKYRAIQNKDSFRSEVLDNELKAADFQSKSKNLTDLSLLYFKNLLWERYKNGRAEYDINNVTDEGKSRSFLQDYPVVLSTAFSAKNNLCPDVLFDYVILDEASQIDVTTGLLALSCAKNAVVVGDSKQLPNVVPDDIRKVTDGIFSFYDLTEGYNYSNNSFLDSIRKIFEPVPEIRLVEHYRCHPKIASFFNNEFYGGDLVVMTEDKGEKDVLILRYTVPGNHALNWRNNREEEEIEDVLSDYDIRSATENYGIIAPYNGQVSRIKDDEDIEVDAKVSTVHKFQGQEKDTIIMSTVDNRYSDFVNNPNLLNVAVSRARKRLILVTNRNDGNSGHVQKLVEYITKNGKVEDGEVKSLYDLIYAGYEKQRDDFLHSHPQMPGEWLQKKDAVSIAEKITYGFIMDVIKDFPGLTVGFRISLKELLPKVNCPSMSEKENAYANHDNTHVDFVISKGEKNILAIEVDGATYHYPGTDQYDRDRMKDKIVQEVCGIEMARFGTKESINEVERLRGMINEII